MHVCIGIALAGQELTTLAWPADNCVETVSLWGARTAVSWLLPSSPSTLLCCDSEAEVEDSDTCLMTGQWLR